MKSESEVVEVEIVEIDGIAVEADSRGGGRAEQKGRPAVWGHWQGRLRRFDRRWMPLWIALGIVFGVVILVVGGLIAILVLLVLLFRGMLRLLLGR
jgi:hypothetical protein